MKFNKYTGKFIRYLPIEERKKAFKVTKAEKALILSSRVKRGISSIAINDSELVERPCFLCRISDEMIKREIHDSCLKEFANQKPIIKETNRVLNEIRDELAITVLGDSLTQNDVKLQGFFDRIHEIMGTS